jgi:hypothetical protein
MFSGEELEGKQLATSRVLVEVKFADRYSISSNFIVVLEASLGNFSMALLLLWMWGFSLHGWKIKRRGWFGYDWPEFELINTFNTC